MPARAMWKGLLRLGRVKVPVKLYAAVEDRSVHFRLLHSKDRSPVKQVLVNPRSDAVVSYQDAHRAYLTPDKDLVMLSNEELEAARPSPSRDIRVLAFLPPGAIDHRWYLRPYYLGPDEGGGEAYRALTSALDDYGREGIATWTMRNTEYAGALRLHAGYPMLITLRHADEVISVSALDVPGGAPLDQRELLMAGQLVDMLADDFDPGRYHDAYRDRVQALIQTKASGGKIRTLPRRQPPVVYDLGRALEASLRQERKRA